MRGGTVPTSFLQDILFKAPPEDLSISGPSDRGVGECLVKLIELKQGGNLLRVLRFDFMLDATAGSWAGKSTRSGLTRKRSDLNPLFTYVHGCSSSNHARIVHTFCSMYGDPHATLSFFLFL